ncbi:hypothetical protein [Hydrogenothermus marinus]|uniref:Cobalt/nickel transport system permease protein n=1 Tax=Hydrogenothermus marinus TaxID=133270 RepID=A0A3M0BL08_9AQUI|nr:hypothetical protein [Hydrogenothermus marinus]RMA97847.1 cobalt/nickel transport system permease protein [Hydrogenothermus marinus]
MIEKILFFIYFFSAFLLVYFQNIYILSIAFILLGVLAYKNFWEIFIKTLVILWVFNGFVSLSYIIFSLIKNENPLDFIILFNLRVFDITFMSLLFSKRVNIIKAVSFSKTLSFLTTVSLLQINNFKKTFKDFQFALKSRTIKPIKDRKKREFIGMMTIYFFKKANHNAEEVSLALKSRGFFDKMQ